MADVPRGHGIVGFGVRRAGGRARSSTSSQLGACSGRARWPCTACRCRQSDLATLAERGSTLVTCPRSNARTGAGSATDWPSSTSRASVSRSVPTALPAHRISTSSRSWPRCARWRPIGAGCIAPRERHAPRGGGSRVRRLRHHRARPAGAAPGRRDSSRLRRCGRIPGVRNPARRHPMAGRSI